MELYKAQLAIAQHRDGAVLVDAVKGTGKTVTMVERARLLLSKNAKAKVLILTPS